MNFLNRKYQLGPVVTHLTYPSCVDHHQKTLAALAPKLYKTSKEILQDWHNYPTRSQRVGITEL